jgi:hypothetical protein
MLKKSVLIPAVLLWLQAGGKIHYGLLWCAAKA